MKTRNGKHNRLWLTVLLCLAALVLAIGASWAIYTNQGYKKGVATTTQSETRFSSNRLEQITETNLQDEDKITKRTVTVTVINNDPDKDLAKGTAEFEFDIYNYAPNMPTSVNQNDITYTVTLELVGTATGVGGEGYKVNGTPFTDTTCTLTGQTLARGVANTNNYKVIMPQADLAKNVQFKVVAKAEGTSQNAVNSMQLAAILTPMQVSGGTTAASWTGHWVEAKLTPAPKPSECTVFNYEISGTGAGTVALTCPTGLTIDPYFLERVTYTTAGDTYTLTVDGEKTSVYNIRFYRNNTALQAPYSGDSFDGWPVISTFTPAPTPTPAP